MQMLKYKFMHLGNAFYHSNLNNPVEIFILLIKVAFKLDQLTWQKYFTTVENRIPDKLSIDNQTSLTELPVSG